MDDRELIEAFETCRLPASAFHHREHVQLTLAYLERYPLPETLTRLREGLLRFATKNGVPEKYHETITFAFAILINQRRMALGRDRSFEAFRAQNPDLFDRSALERYYPPKVLASEEARLFFVLPPREAFVSA